MYKLVSYLIIALIAFTSLACTFAACDSENILADNNTIIIDEQPILINEQSIDDNNTDVDLNYNATTGFVLPLTEDETNYYFNVLKSFYNKTLTNNDTDLDNNTIIIDEQPILINEQSIDDNNTDLDYNAITGFVLPLTEDETNYYFNVLKSFYNKTLTNDYD